MSDLERVRHAKTAADRLSRPRLSQTVSAAAQSRADPARNRRRTRFGAVYGGSPLGSFRGHGQNRARTSQSARDPLARSPKMMD